MPLLVSFPDDPLALNWCQPPPVDVTNHSHIINITYSVSHFPPNHKFAQFLYRFQKILAYKLKGNNLILKLSTLMIELMHLSKAGAT